MDKVYVAIDLKSFYASCECVELGLDPLNTNLVVADQSRTEKTICLAVSPSLKSYGISGRARLFEVVKRVKEVNEERQKKAPHRQLTDKSFIYSELVQNPSLAVDYVIATPQMAHYMKVSADIYGIYLKYVAPEDIFAYSVDEVFIDATGYLNTYHTDGHGFARMLIQDVLDTTGITATAGVGTNMFLCKVAMDIVAKHIPADKDGVRIAELDEQTFKDKWWSHTPITDFWRVGAGTAKRLEALHIYTMGDIARCSMESLRTSLSSYAGMPSGRNLPFAFGIYVRLTGSGLYWNFFIRSTSRCIFSLAFSSYCTLLTPSIPTAFFPLCFRCSAIRLCSLTLCISPCTVAKCSD